MFKFSAIFNALILSMFISSCVPQNTKKQSREFSSINTDGSSGVYFSATAYLADELKSMLLSDSRIRNLLIRENSTLEATEDICGSNLCTILHTQAKRSYTSEEVEQAFQDMSLENELSEMSEGEKDSFTKIADDALESVFKGMGGLFGKDGFFLGLSGQKKFSGKVFFTIYHDANPQKSFLIWHENQPIFGMGSAISKKYATSIITIFAERTQKHGFEWNPSESVSNNATPSAGWKIAIPVDFLNQDVSKKKAQNDSQSGSQNNAGRQTDSSSSSKEVRDCGDGLEILKEGNGGIVPKTKEEAKKAHRVLVKKYHPDLNRGASAAESSRINQKFLSVQAAWECLDANM